MAIGSGLPPTTQTALRNLSSINVELSRSTSKLATGSKINRAWDNPAGLVSSENLRATLAALEAESASLQRVDHVATTADSSLSETSDQLARANGLAVQLANDSGLSSGEKAAIQGEIDSILTSVSRTASTSSFAGNNLLDGSTSLQAGGDTLVLPNAAPGSLGETQIDGVTYNLTDAGSNGALASDPAKQQQVIAAAISDVATARGQIGSFQKNTVGSRLNVVRNAMEQTTAAESSIRDTDFASQTANLVRVRALGQATVKALSVANESHKSVLNLLS